MNIGFVFNSAWLNSRDGYYVKVKELYYELARHHKVISTPAPFSVGKIGYNNRKDFFKFSSSLDALIIIAGSFYTDKFTFSNLFRKRKIPIIWILEAPVEEALLLPWANKRNIFWNKVRMKFMAKRVDLCLCVSSEIQDYAQKELGIDNTIVLPNGANPNIFKKTKKLNIGLGKLKGCFKVIWAGAGQYPWQAIDLVVSVARRLRKHKDIVFLIITDQSWFPIPKNLDNIIFLKSVDHAALPKYLNLADVLLCLYKTNFQGRLYNSPMKLFEFMSMEKPVIGSDIGQIGEIIIDYKNGLLTNNSVEDISKKILLLKANPKLANKLSTDARSLILNEYNWKSIAERVVFKIKQLQS